MISVYNCVVILLRRKTINNKFSTSNPFVSMQFCCFPLDYSLNFCNTKAVRDFQKGVLRIKALSQSFVCVTMVLIGLAFEHDANLNKQL